MMGVRVRVRVMKVRVGVGGGDEISSSSGGGSFAFMGVLVAAQGLGSAELTWTIETGEHSRSSSSITSINSGG